MDVHNLIGRKRPLFELDLETHQKEMAAAIRGARVLIYGGAGSIGKEVAAQIFARSPAALHIVDISENNLVELVRDLRSSVGYIEGETRFLPLDMGGLEMEAYLAAQEPYDFILNLAAMKHVRSEKDEFSLMRMVKTNVLDVVRTVEFATRGEGKYFAVSTDKAKNPANLMGATKRIMEDALFTNEGGVPVSTARFANVAFSDGSLLHGFNQRLAKHQPISAPKDIRRYFLTGAEAGLLCLFSVTLGNHGDIFFPKLDAGLHLLSFSEIATNYLEDKGLTPVIVDSEDEARARVGELAAKRCWPCYFFASDTSGEKPFEEFYSAGDDVDWKRFTDVGVINSKIDSSVLIRATAFVQAIERLREARTWSREDIVSLIKAGCPELDHVETGRTLDGRM